MLTHAQFAVSKFAVSKFTVHTQEKRLMFSALGIVCTLIFESSVLSIQYTVQNSFEYQATNTSTLSVGEEKS